MSRRENIDELVDRLREHGAVELHQNEYIARLILFYDGIRQGLEGRVPEKSLDHVAATLTAGYWASRE
ncbi:hypothetical protein PT7_1567 [Pusillimonas sp. T7-7]|uniref:hypothetical protein n=1 Tax=Pusillimonas sp. (strain T7-7) TaxID=1007105 RepID=UPI0002085045|nr:hypothetical protein [Pusillimonas sp. T7-7]AEC20107.1 hypothetical protein PT7_1567 [Pusillimonas sp. T7-7]